MKKLNVNSIRGLDKPAMNISSELPNLKAINTTDFKYNKTAAICCVARNIASVYPNASLNIKRIANWFKTSYIVIIESDSDDNSLELLSKIPNVNLARMGNLSTKIPLKEERIAFCRNKYLQAVLARKNDIDLLINLDLNDLMTEEVDEFLFENCLNEAQYPKWDAVFANQSYRYFDIRSLRNGNVNADWVEKMKTSKQSKHDCVWKHQHHIPRNSGLIPVKSAFGGLGVYKVSSIDDNCKYIGVVNKTNTSISEHVPLNLYLSGKGCKLFIDSSMVLLTPPSFSKYYV